MPISKHRRKGVRRLPPRRVDRKVWYWQGLASFEQAWAVREAAESAGVSVDVAYDWSDGVLMLRTFDRQGVDGVLEAVGV